MVYELYATNSKYKTNQLTNCTCNYFDDLKKFTVKSHVRAANQHARCNQSQTHLTSNNGQQLMTMARYGDVIHCVNKNYLEVIYP